MVGEVRGGEALDMLQAMNTGHDGLLTTVHANSPRDVLSRLETMVLMAGVDIPMRAIREQISSAINLIVQARLKDGTRRLTHVTEIVGMEGDVITLQDIFVFDYRAGIDENGRFRGIIQPTGLRPRFLDRLIDQGVHFESELFQHESGSVPPGDASMSRRIARVGSLLLAGFLVGRLPWRSRPPGSRRSRQRSSHGTSTRARGGSS